MEQYLKENVQFDPLKHFWGPAASYNTQTRLSKFALGLSFC